MSNHFSMGAINKTTNYENYFIYAYNKDYYKNKMKNKKYTKRRTLKIYKGLKESYNKLFIL